MFGIFEQVLSRHVMAGSMPPDPAMLEPDAEKPPSGGAGLGRMQLKEDGQLSGTSLAHRQIFLSLREDVSLSPWPKACCGGMPTAG